MSWLQRVRDFLHRREPVPKAQRETIKRADRLLERAENVLHPELKSYRRVRL